MSNDNKKKAAKISSDLLPVTLSGKNTGDWVTLMYGSELASLLLPSLWGERRLTIVI